MMPYGITSPQWIMIQVISTSLTQLITNKDHQDYMQSAGQTS